MIKFVSGFENTKIYVLRDSEAHSDLIYVTVENDGCTIHNENLTSYYDTEKISMEQAKEFGEFLIELASKKVDQTKLSKGDRVQIVLSRPYTEEEIMDLGCDPSVDGRTGVITKHFKELQEGLYEIKLDELVISDHDLHKDTVHESLYGFDVYNETAENLVKIE